MLEKTYTLSFIRQEGGMDSGQTFNDLPSALSAFREYVEPQTVEKFSGITLIEHGIEDDRIIAALAL